MKINNLKLEGAHEILAESHPDERGVLSLTYKSKELSALGLNTEWQEEYHSHTLTKHTVRGLYIQSEPYVEGKLITAIAGTLMWVYVDLRPDSSTFGSWDSIILSPGKRNALYLPKGMAHGCTSLTDDCHVYIKADNLFSHSHGFGIIWNDKDLNIDWRLDGHAALVSPGHSKFGTFEQYKKDMQF